MTEIKHNPWCKQEYDGNGNLLGCMCERPLPPVTDDSGLIRDMEDAAISSFEKFDRMWKRGRGLSHEGHSVLLQAITAYAELRKATAIERIADALEGNPAPNTSEYVSGIRIGIFNGKRTLRAYILGGNRVEGDYNDYPLDGLFEPIGRTDISITDAVSEHKRTCYCQTTYPSEAQARECAASHI